MALGEWKLYGQGERTNDAKYEARHLMAQLSGREATERVRTDSPSAQDQEMLGELESHYSIGTPVSSWKYFTEHVPIFQDALTALMFKARMDFVKTVFSELTLATKANRREEKKVPINDRTIEVDERYDEIFFFAQEGLAAAVGGGGILGCQDVLAALEKQDGNPFLILKRSLAGRIAGNTQAIENPFFYSLPTKVPNVDLKFDYPRGQEYPSLTLIVKPFSF